MKKFYLMKSTKINEIETKKDKIIWQRTTNN